MYLPGDHFLSDAGFTGNNNGTFTAGNGADKLKNRIERPGGTDELRAVYAGKAAAGPVIQACAATDRPEIFPFTLSA